MYTRRNFLKHSAVMMASLAAPDFLNPLLSHTARSAWAGPKQSSPRQWLQDYLTAMDAPQFAPLNNIFDDIVDDKGNLCAMIYDVTRGQLIAGLQTESPMPIASAFKGPVFIYFMDVIDESVWTSLPFEYWRETNKTNVPEEYHDAWTEHINILNDMYRSVVLSENQATGRVLTYIARNQGSNHPLALFNDWSHQVVNVSQMSILSSWGYGIPDTVNSKDERYFDRTAILNHQLVPFNNVMTPRDLGLYYIWWQSQMSDTARRVGQEALGYIHDDRRSNIERIAYELGGVSYSKNGSLSVAETGVAAVVTDGGLVDVPDLGYYLVVYLAGIADTRTPRIFARIGEVISGVYDADIAANQGVEELDAEQRQFYTTYLETMYPNSGTISTDSYNYAFVKYEGVEVFLSPDTSRPTRNPVISSSRFGVHLLMQGALARYLPYNDEWVEMIPDSPKDNVQLKMGAPLYVRRSDLHPISNEYTTLIPYLFDARVTSEEKMVIIDIRRRELTLFERDKAIFKTPVVINDIDTPRGGHLTTTHWLSCSMQPWAPGVPFTTYFHEEGYAIHGAPWQRWEKTVNRENIFTRTSAGCVNVPNWTVTIGDYTRPLDEIIFRWLGGVAEPQNKPYEYGTREHPAVRIYLVDYLADLYSYNIGRGYQALGIGWDVIILETEAIATTAPEPFFTVS